MIRIISVYTRKGEINVAEIKHIIEGMGKVIKVRSFIDEDLNMEDKTIKLLEENMLMALAHGGEYLSKTHTVYSREQD